MPCPWLVEGAAVHNVVLVVIALAIFVTLRDINSSVVAAATGLWLLAIGMFIASNLALQMLKLSEQIAAAATKEQRPPTVAAGRRCWGNWEGSVFQVSYVVGQLAGIVIGSSCCGPARSDGSSHTP